MARLATFLALLAVCAPAAQAQPAPALSLEHKMLLRCSAAFALVANRQAGEDAAVRAYPPLKERGSEFFVQASVRVMDEAGLDRAAITAELTREAQALLAPGALAGIMPACLDALEASGI